MLTPQQLQRAAGEMGFPVDAYEKVWMLVRLLRLVASHPFLGPRVAFLLRMTALARRPDGRGVVGPAAAAKHHEDPGADRRRHERRYHRRHTCLRLRRTGASPRHCILRSYPSRARPQQAQPGDRAAAPLRILLPGLRPVQPS